MSHMFTIVIVDDEPNILELYEQYIPAEKYNIVSFVSPKEAILFIEENSNEIALIISDFKMPQMNGFQFREATQSKAGEIPFAIVTGYYDKEMATKAMELHICSFLEKPVEEEEIKTLIEKEGKRRIESLLEDREMISEFLQETKPMLEEIEELILALEDDPHDDRAVNTYFRLLHTIKGTSSCLGLDEIAKFSHKYEDLITRVKEHQISVNRQVINVLLKGLDELKLLYLLAENFKPFPSDLDEKAEMFDGDFHDETATKVVSGEDDGTREVTVEDNKDKGRVEKEEKVTVSEKLLSHFLEMSGELTVIRNSIFKNLVRVQDKLPHDKDVEHLHENLIEMQKVSAILQNQIAEMKKVSIENVYRPMKRVVRDSCSVLDKKVDFEIKGDSLKVDTSVAKLLNGTLVHLLRNGVDHGIEEPSTRELKGKDPTGKLILNSYETGEEIVVEVIDDGKGLDKNLLKKKALEKGLYTEEQLSHMSDQRIYSIIFESGFSTNTEVTSVSGRGVGMDMVKSTIEEFGGRILIDSEVGRGSKFILIIPIPRSILIIKSLMVQAQENKLNIPLDDVDEVVLYDKSKKDQKVFETNGSLVLKHHNILCPLIDLSKTLELGVTDFHEGESQNIVIVKGEGFRYGLMVDAIADIEEIVVKKLSRHFDVPEYLGTTFADDGALSLILDCKGIGWKYGIDNQVEDDTSRFLETKKVKEEMNEFMRFSLKSMPNCALPLESVYRLEEMNSKDIQFSGQKALIRYRGFSLPLIHIEHLLGMIEESLEDIQKEDLVLSVLVIQHQEKLYGAIIKELQDIAISEDKVETAFSDREGILGTVTIDDKIVSVMDIEYLAKGKQGVLKFSNMDQDSQEESAA